MLLHRLLSPAFLHFFRTRTQHRGTRTRTRIIPPMLLVLLGSVESFMVENRFCHLAPFEYEYRHAEFDYDIDSDLQNRDADKELGNGADIFICLVREAWRDTLDVSAMLCRYQAKKLCRKVAPFMHATHSRAIAASAPLHLQFAAIITFPKSH